MGAVFFVDLGNEVSSLPRSTKKTAPIVNIGNELSSRTRKFSLVSCR